METKLPRIQAVRAWGAGDPAQVSVTWTGRADAETVDLAGWIATGGDILAPLADPRVFARAAVSEHGAGVTWDGNEGDLAIDALHLSRIAAAQRPFGPADIAAWQAKLALSNSEAARMLGLSTSTWSTYRGGTAPIPISVAIACRSAELDPVVLQAHLRPARRRGRPRKAVAADPQSGLTKALGLGSEPADRARRARSSRPRPVKA